MMDAVLPVCTLLHDYSVKTNAGLLTNYHYVMNLR